MNNPRIRAKLYVSTVNSNVVCHEEPYASAPPAAHLFLTPVYSMRPDAENRAFWEATPAGSLQMRIGGYDRPTTDADPGFAATPLETMPLGSFWYADVVEDPEGSMVLRQSELGEQGEYRWAVAKLENEVYEHSVGHARLEMTINNPRAVEAFARPLGTRYRLDLVPTTKLGD